MPFDILRGAGGVQLHSPELVKVNAYKGELRLSLYLLFLPCPRVRGRTAAFSAKRDEDNDGRGRKEGA